MASYCDASDVEAEIRADNSFSASTTPTLSTVNDWITEASDEIRDLADKEFGSESVTGEFYHYYGDRVISPRNTPLVSVSDVKYNEDSLDSPNYVSKTEGDDYTVIKERSQIHLMKGFNPKTGLKRFKLDYSYGKGSIPSKIKKLCTKMVALRVLDSLLASDVNNENAGSDVQVGSIQVKKPADYGAVNYKLLREEIEKLKDDLETGSRTFRSNVYR